MKKIMFNDKYGLTDAVLTGRKTMTRRIIPLTDTDREYLNTAFDRDLRERVIIDRYAKYKVGEVVAVAQRYRDLSSDSRLYKKIKLLCPGEMPWNILKGWDNKMFVLADLMPHHIRITDIKVERLQDISDGNCLEEGITQVDMGFSYRCPCGVCGFSNPKEAFASLIDAISGKGTWALNPFVFVYTFILVD